MFQTFYKFEEKLFFDGKNSKKINLDDFSVVKVCVSYSTKIIVFKIRLKVHQKWKRISTDEYFFGKKKWLKTNWLFLSFFPLFFRKDEKRGKNNRDIFHLTNSLSYLIFQFVSPSATSNIKHISKLYTLSIKIISSIQEQNLIKIIVLDTSLYNNNL